MIRGVIFDCFGVLYSGSLESLTSRLRTEQATRMRDVNKSYDYGYISREEYIAGFAEILGTSPEQITETLRDRHVRNTELVAYARSLKPKYRIGLLSNVGAGTMEKLFSEEEREQLFDATVLSYEEGITKPHPDAFLLAVLRLGLRPEECVMIDDLMDNCESAKVAGLHAILHTSNESTKQKLDELLLHDASL